MTILELLSRTKEFSVRIIKGEKLSELMQGGQQPFKTISRSIKIVKAKGQ
jgi:hypothetical protein